MKKGYFTSTLEYRGGEGTKRRAAAYYKRLLEARLVVANYVKLGKSGKLNTSIEAGIEAIRELKNGFRGEIACLPKTYVVITRECQGRNISAISPLFESSMKGVRDSIRARIRENRAELKNNDYLASRFPGRIVKRFQTKLLGKFKRPDSGDLSQHVGIEIECVVPENACYDALMPFAKYINVGSDGSIEYGNNEKGVEFRVCMKRSEIRSVLPGLMSAIKSIGARVNKSCGLHVHLDQRNVSEPALSYSKLVRSLGLLYSVVPSSRRNNHFCKKNTKADFSRDAEGGRYRAINAASYFKYRTLEIRLFGGTLSATKIINWIETLYGIVDGDMVNRCPKTFDLAARHWKISAENVAWLKVRQEQFRELNALAPISESETEECIEAIAV